MSSVPPPPTNSSPLPARPELPDGVTGAPLPPPPAGSPDATPLAAVPAWAPFAGLVLIVVMAAVTGSVIAAILGIDLTRGATPPEVAIPGTLVQDGLFILVAFLGVQLWSRARVRPSALGFRTTPLWPAVGWTALAYVGFWAFAILYGMIVGTPPEQDLVRELRAEESLVVLLGYGILVAVGAPLAEETFFRGFLFGVLGEKMSLAAAVLVAGTVFGLLHAIGTPVRTLVILVVLGIVFCLLYWKTGSLLPGMSLHAINNSVTFAATKDVAPWGFPVVVLGSVALVLAIAYAVIAWERRLS